MAEGVHRLLRFGVFEMNLDTQELRNAGTLLKLSPQPFNLLALLVSHAGQIVTREDIQKQLWGEDTYVDFDQGVNKCIKRIRSVLNDNPDRPLYIETLPRKGYRFLAPVVSKTVPAPSPRVTESPSDVLGRARSLFISRLQAGPSAAPVISAATQAPEQVPGPATLQAERPSEATTAEIEPPSVSAGDIPSSKRWRAWTGVAIILLIAALGMYALYRARQRAPTATLPENTFVMADFVNATGEQVFDDTLKQALAVQLEQSPHLQIVSDRGVLHALQMMNLPPNQRLSQQVAVEVCLRTNTKAVLVGSITPVQGKYAISLRALTCETGDLVADTTATSETRQGVLPAVQKVGNELRQHLGESLASIQRFNQPLENATTSSLEALKAYTEGRKLQLNGSSECVPYLKRAVELDPNFALAYAGLAAYYRNMGETSLAHDNYELAYRLRARVTQREQYYIEAHYFEDITGELEKAARTYQDWIAAYPNDYIPYNNLAVLCNTLGRYEMAAEKATRSIELMSENSNAYRALIRSYFSLDRLDEIETVYRRAEQQKLDLTFFIAPEYYSAFLKGDEPGMRNALQAATGRAGVEDLLLSASSDTEAYYGRVVKSRLLSDHAVMSARNAQSPETAALWRANQALREAELGFAGKARSAIADALSMSPGRDIKAIAAMTYARIGDTDKARKMAAQLSAEEPVGTITQDFVVPSVLAAAEIASRDPSRALQLLERTAPYQNGDAATSTASLGNLYPVYLRGMARLQSDTPDFGAADFLYVIQHPGMTTNFVVGPLARLYLARAQVKAGDRQATAKTYQDLLAIWKEADADVPVVRAARSEYSSLE